MIGVRLAEKLVDLLVELADLCAFNPEAAAALREAAAEVHKALRFLKADAPGARTAT